MSQELATEYKGDTILKLERNIHIFFNWNKNLYYISFFDVIFCFGTTITVLVQLFSIWNLAVNTFTHTLFYHRTCFDASILFRLIYLLILCVVYIASMMIDMRSSMSLIICDKLSIPAPISWALICSTTQSHTCAEVTLASSSKFCKSIFLQNYNTL